MKRNTLNLTIDVATAGVMLGMLATGLILRYVLPPGTGQSQALWGLGRHDWGDVHFWLAIGVGTVVLVHLAMHWGWACTTVTRLWRRERAQPPGMGSRCVSGAVAVAVVAAASVLLVWGGRVSVRPTAVVGAPARYERPVEAYWGSSTLGDVAAAEGISLDELRRRLGLGSDVSGETRLSDLRRERGWTMHEIRDAVSQP